MIFYFGLFIGSVYLVTKRPLSEKLLLHYAWDFVLATIGILLFTLHIMSTYIIPYFLSEESSGLPCEVASPQALCYSIKKPICEKAWVSFHESCKIDKAKEIKSMGLSGLVGPIIVKCKAQKFDKMFYYNRVDSTSLICSAYFDSLVSGSDFDTPPIR